MQRIAIPLTLAIAAAGAAGAANSDFGANREAQLVAHSRQLFGVTSPVAESSTESIDAATAEADPAALVTVAGGLLVSVVAASAELGANIDMMAPWPDDVNPTHLIVCNEQGTDLPGVQRIALADGRVETILTGTSSCDPAHRTAWGTVIVAEERPDGWMLEIANPLETTNVIFDRASGTLSNSPDGTGAANIVVRPAVGHTSFEGVALYDSGVMYYGDENRPFQGTGGGAYFKFVPATPWDGVSMGLAASPLADGQVYGLRLGKRSGGTDYGQGTSAGRGTWVEITPSFDANLRAAAADLALTGYYRPEDAQIDLRAQAEGLVRVCANNTGNEGSDQYYGEMICITDGTLEEALTNTPEPEVQNLVIGTPELAMMDNLAYQPGRGNWLLQEDGEGPGVGRNNDIFSCLDDGDDTDLLSDGCVRILTINDLNAETTGGIFDGPGDRYWVSVQHNVTGHGVVLEITGWK